MQPNSVESLSTWRFDHPWLSEEFAAVSREQAVGSNSREHHYVPFFYLKRWAIEMKIQPTLIDARTAERPVSPRKAGCLRHFYSLPRTEETMDLPLKWVETHLSRIETPCAVRFRELDAIGTGRVMDAQLKRDLAVFLGLQRTRTPSQRECSMVIIKGPTSAKKEVYRLLNPTLSEIDLAAACRPKYTDDKLEAIHLMISDVRNVLGRALYKRRWAIYETAKPIITCDDPVVALAGPPAPRASFVGFPSSAAVLYPIDPFHLLVLLRSDLQHRGPFQLNEAETDSINLEIAAAATKTTFERIGDAIATTLEVPRRDSVAPLSDEDFARMDRTTAIGILLNKGTPRSRWSDAAQAPDWPVPRWYA